MGWRRLLVMGLCACNALSGINALEESACVECTVADDAGRRDDGDITTTQETGARDADHEDAEGVVDAGDQDHDAAIDATDAGRVTKVDQSSAFGNTNYSVFTPSLVWQQQVQAGTSGVLAGVSLKFVDTGQVHLRIRKGNAWNTNGAVFDAIVTVAGSQPQYIDVSSSSIGLVSGEKFVLEIQGASGIASLFGSTMSPPAYSQPLFLNEVSQTGRFGFTTYVTLP